jgi:hypothetical protein
MVTSARHPSTASGAFELHGRVGEVTVRYGVNDDPAYWGYPVLGLPYDDNVACGFPVVEARVQYEGAGYHAFMGWIQVVRLTYGDSPLVVIIDRPPSLLDVDVPFLTMGPCPTLFDAPSTVWPNAHWRADSFLVASPDAVMTKTVMPLFSFCWGYDSDEHGVVTPRLCERQALSTWHDVRSLISEQHPAWRLLDAPDDR